METRSLRPYIVIVCLMALTSLAFAFSVDVSLTDEAGVHLRLPGTLGNWSGDEIRFCQNPKCRKSWVASEIDEPELWGRLSDKSLSEEDILPKDTGMLKKVYTHPTGRSVHASVVLSARERGSIHRPEVCLTGQGQDLTAKHVIEVPIDGREEPLQVMVLELERKFRIEGGKSRKHGTYYAYWFIGKDRETPHHHMRMALMAFDRIFRNVAHRWAYISVDGIREIGSEDYHDEIRTFISDLYPAIKIDST